MAEEGIRSSRVARKCADVARIIVKQEIRARVKQVHITKHVKIALM